MSVKTPNDSKTSAMDVIDGCLIAAEQVPYAAEERPFFATAATDSRHGLVDSTRKATEWQRLQPDTPRTGQRREKQPLAAEQRGLHAPHELNVVTHRRLQGDDAPGVHAHGLARLEVEGMHGPAGMDETESVAIQALHDESLAAEQP